MSGHNHVCSLESCENDATDRCSVCKSVLYCCREHQKEHWKVHKKSCTIKAPYAAENIPIPRSPKVLVVTGLMFDAEDCFMSKNLIPKLRAKSIPVEAINFTKEKLLEKLTSGTFSTCVVFQLGSGGNDKSFFSQELKNVFVPWVHKGGKLIITGERQCLKVFNEWFGKSWAFKGDFYRRTVHVLNPKFTALPALTWTTGLLPQQSNCKAVMLSDVDITERLYIPTQGAVSASVLPMAGFAGVEINPDFCLVAAAEVGSGHVAFSGDVNAEESTMNIIATLCVI